MGKQTTASKEIRKSLSCERKEIIDIMQELVKAKNRLIDLTHLEIFGMVYRHDLNTVDEHISDVCYLLGNIVGNTIAWDISDGEEVKHDI